MTKDKVTMFIILLFGLNACGASWSSTYLDYMDTSPRNLCIGWFERIGGNVHAAPMGEALDRRQIDCEPYREAMVAAKIARDDYYDGLKENLDNLGSSSSGTTQRKQVNCRTRKVGNYVRTFCF